MIFATIENDLRKIMDFRALTVIFNVRSWKTLKNLYNFFLGYDKNQNLCQLTCLALHVYQIW